MIKRKEKQSNWYDRKTPIGHDSHALVARQRQKTEKSRQKFAEGKEIYLLI